MSHYERTSYRLRPVSISGPLFTPPSQCTEKLTGKQLDVWMESVARVTEERKEAGLDVLCPRAILYGLGLVGAQADQVVAAIEGEE